MRNKFFDYIANKIAPFHHESRAEQDRICRTYNMFWGMPTDSTMSLTDDGRRVITGASIILQDRTGKSWDHLMVAPFWGNYNFGDSSFCCLAAFFNEVGLQPAWSEMNGQPCIELIPASSPDAVTKESFNRICDVIRRGGSRGMASHRNPGLEGIISEALGRSTNTDELLENLNTGGRHWVYTNGLLGYVVNNTSYIYNIQESVGKCAECPILRKLMDDEFGNDELHLVKVGNHFELWSDKPSWRKALKSIGDMNSIDVANYKDLTPQEWLQQIRNVVNIIS